MNITDGEAFARLEIPSAGIDYFVYPGVTREALQDGPGHYPNTPLPGMLGNAAIAGHRTTYGQPLRNVDQIEPGDEIIVTMPYGRFVYTMTAAEIVSPSDTDVIATTDPTMARLTLTTCHPVFSAAQRYIVSAELDRTQSPAPAAAILNYGRVGPAPTGDGLDTEGSATTDEGVTVAPSTVPLTTPSATTAVDASDSLSTAAGSDAALTSTMPNTTLRPTTTATPDSLYSVVPGGFEGGRSGAGAADPTGATDEEAIDSFSDQWFSDTAALPQVALWALGCIAVFVAAYQLAKLRRNSWIGLAVGVAPFAVALYFFYENVNRLLPAAL